jgi:prevent-host-death family protein
MRYNVHEAKTKLSRLLELAESGEEVIIARNGKPIVRLEPIRIPAARVLGQARGTVPIPGPGVFRAMTDEEADDFLEGR